MIKCNYFILAFRLECQKIARKMKEKLINIVLGDGREEVNFVLGAHDGKLVL